MVFWVVSDNFIVPTSSLIRERIPKYLSRGLDEEAKFVIHGGLERLNWSSIDPLSEEKGIGVENTE